MGNSAISAMILGLCAGLGFFLYGMKLMSVGLEKVAGSKMKDILNWCTKNTGIGVAVGVIFTAVIQSSSATTVMVTSFVNSGLLSIYQAIGPIIGANVGTAVTGQLVSFKLDAVAPIFILVGVIMINFMKKPMVKNVGEVLFGFGVLFFGMSTLKSSMARLEDLPSVVDAINSVNNPVAAIGIGLLITGVLQSSSAAVGIVIGMAASGIFTNLTTANYFILGSNIGATTPAVLASLQGNKNAKRAALSDVLYNAITALVFAFVFIVFGDKFNSFIMDISNGSGKYQMSRAVANSQLTIKVAQMIVAFPIAKYIVKLSETIIKGADKEIEPCELKYINRGAAILPTTCVLQATREINRMGVHAIENLDRAFDALISKDLSKIDEVYETEKQIDYLSKEITNYLVKIAQTDMPINDAKYIDGYFHVVSDIERIGDHAENIAEFAQTRVKDDIHFSEVGVSELTGMYNKVKNLLKLSLEAFVNKEKTHLLEIQLLEDEIDGLEVQLEKNHVKRMTEGTCSPKSAIYSDLVSNFERVGDHSINIAYAIFEDDEDSVEEKLQNA